MPSKLISQYRELEKGKYGFMVDIGLFVLITYGFHLVFRFFAADIMSLGFVNKSAYWLSDAAYRISLWFNQNILGMQIVTRDDNSMWFTNQHGVIVNLSCSGLKQFYQVLVLFVLFPGPWKHKAWFIPMGFAVMFLVNVFRIIVLCVIMAWRPEYFEFSHTWILRPFFYVILFALWVWWVEKFRRKPQIS